MESSQLSNSAQNQAAIILNPSELLPSKAFAQHVFFLKYGKDFEVTRRGIAQVAFGMFRTLYEYIQKLFELPELSDHPQVTIYDDNTFSINWWGEVLYC